MSAVRASEDSSDDDSCPSPCSSASLTPPISPHSSFTSEQSPFSPSSFTRVATVLWKDRQGTWKPRTLGVEGEFLSIYKLKSREEEARIPLQGVTISVSEELKSSASLKFVMLSHKASSKPCCFRCDTDEDTDAWYKFLLPVVDRSSADYFTNALPAELLVQVFMNLTAKDLHMVARACRRFNEICTDASLALWRRWFCQKYPSNLRNLVEEAIPILGVSWRWFCCCKPTDDKVTAMTGMGFAQNRVRVYLGELKNGKPNGKGVRWHILGSKYIGEWKDGVSEGKGVLVDTAGDRYEGTFVKGLPEGTVQVVHTNGNVYEGDFKAGRRHGHGVLHCLAMGKTYEGEFRLGKIIGKGVLISANGNRYEGEFVNGKKSGKGVLLYANKDRYEGEFLNNKCEGYGVLEYANGDKYSGSFKIGRCEGKGTLICQNGFKYEGEWRHGKFEGKGTLWYANGNVYEGLFSKGKPEGMGLYRHKTGERYQGLFKKGKREGKGTLSFPNGEKFDGEFKKSKVRGKGVYYRANGEKEEMSYPN